MKQICRIIISIFILVFFISCEDKEKKLNNAKKIASIDSGRKLFVSNCIVCHGVNGVGLAKDWKIQVDGKYPPPPLNGTAHTWHHSRELLASIIKEGSAKNGGNMPPFEHLSKENIENILDYLYDLWPKDIQNSYDKMFISLIRDDEN